jgi:hypothetical protein
MVRNPASSSGESGEPSVPRPSSLFWAKGFADATIAAVGRTAFKLVGEFVLGTRSLTGEPVPASTAPHDWPRGGSRARASPMTRRAHRPISIESCATYGRPPGVLVLRRDVYVGASSSEVQPVLQQALSRLFKARHNLVWPR